MQIAHCWYDGGDTLKMTYNNFIYRSVWTLCRVLHTCTKVVSVMALLKGCVNRVSKNSMLI